MKLPKTLGRSRTSAKVIRRYKVFVDTADLESMLNVDTAMGTVSEDTSTNDRSEGVSENTDHSEEIDVSEFDCEMKTQTDVWASVQSMGDMVYGLPALVPSNENLRFDSDKSE